MARPIYDQACRFAARLNAFAFLLWLFAEVKDSLYFVQWLDPRAVRFPGVEDRTDDTVAEVRSRLESHWRGAVLIEYQGEPDPEGADRWTEYIAVHRRGLRWGPQARRKFDVTLVLLQLTGRRPEDRLTMGIPGLASPAVDVRIRVRALAEEDAGATLAEIRQGTVDPCVLPWVPLMRRARKGAIIEEWLAMARQEPNRQRRADYGALALVFAEKAGRVAVWRAALEGWNVEESVIGAEWMARGRAEGRVEGQTEGRAVGRAEGRAVGRTEGAEAVLLRQGRKRFGPADAATRARLQAQLAAGRSEVLADRLMEVETWEEFLR